MKFYKQIEKTQRSEFEFLENKKHNKIGQKLELDDELRL